MNGRIKIPRACATALVLLSVALPASGQTRSELVAEQLKWRIEQLRAEGWLDIQGRWVSGYALTLAAYEEREFLPLWGDAAALDSLRAAIAALEWEGLDPEHYHLSVLASPSMVVPGGRGEPSAAGGEDSATRMAQLDLLATDAFVQAAHDLRFGRVKAEGPMGEGVPWPFGGDDALRELLATVSSRGIGQALTALSSRHFVYEGLKETLARLRTIESSGGWEPVPEGPTMSRDSVDVRVPLLRSRLVQEGDLRPAAAVSGSRYDGVLEDAVKAFQRRHGLNEDGAVGPSTLEALNVPVRRRIDQVRVNLERARWVLPTLPDTAVVVNAAGARVFLLQGDSVAFDGRAIVGKEDTETPAFAATMRSVDLNPTWTVPPGIVDEVLAHVRTDAAYLSEHQMQVLDRSGRPMDPDSVDFAPSGSDFPYVFRQNPGPTNPLGKIKFLFPNPYNVYLHDTPGTQLFRQEERLFSHGCIRLEDPLDLAVLILGDSTEWSLETLQAALGTGETRTIQLPQPIPVFVLYWTAAVDGRGRPVFYDDVYGRDETILEALAAPRAPGTLEGLRR